MLFTLNTQFKDLTGARHALKSKAKGVVIKNIN